MKRYFVFSFLVLLSVICFAQAQQSVLGINTNTTMKKFNKALLAKGHKPTQTAPGLYEYKVTYAGFPNCEMEVKFNNRNDSVLYVTIFFPHESYTKDKTIFKNLTQQFKEKYGNESDWSDINEMIGSKNQMKVYGKLKDNMITVCLYYDDEDEEDGIVVQYRTRATIEKTVSVSPDI